MMRQREDRRRVVLASRMRCGAQWRDARMVNLSSRGLGLTAATPPDPGTYVEIRRGHYVIVARVMWTNGLRFGVQTQDPISIDGLIQEPGSAEAAPAAPAGSEPRVERRRAPRSFAFQHDQSRAAGQRLEFLFLAILAASAAVFGFHLISEAVGGPLAKVEKRLAD
jgi:hypothetical protein